MAEYFVHESSYVDAGARIGKGTKIWHFCHVMPGAVIGERCNLGQNVVVRSEEHTSELQSLAYLVCRLLLEKKKKIRLPVLHLLPRTVSPYPPQHRSAVA